VFERLAAAAESSSDRAAAIEAAFDTLERRIAADFALLRGELAGLAEVERERRASAASALIAEQLGAAARSLLTSFAPRGDT
jgi:hypothetical protein